jgi:hypothetical protein
VVKWVMQSRQARPSLIRAGSSLSDVVLVIATALNKEGICAVLTGEAAAAMHMPGAQLGERLNYSLTSPATASRLASAIRHLGFEPADDGRYRHADINVVLELIQTPLMIGRAVVVSQTLQLRHGFVRILSPTDCCREQLLQWQAAGQDGPGMQRAVSLAKQCEINMPDMRVWMRKEGLLGLWPGFKRLVEGNARTAAFAPPQPARSSRLR